MTDWLKNKRQLFERVVLPHLEAAYNLAARLTNSHDADDVVQDAYLKAFRLFDSYQDHNSKAWILTIVRNTAYSWLHKNRRHRSHLAWDDENLQALDPIHQTGCLDPSDWLALAADLSRLYAALDKLPFIFNEIIVLREIEGCDYKEISEILSLPPGTVMSRLSRARQALQQLLRLDKPKGMQNEL